VRNMFLRKLKTTLDYFSNNISKHAVLIAHISGYFKVSLYIILSTFLFIKFANTCLMTYVNHICIMHKESCELDRSFLNSFKKKSIFSILSHYPVFPFPISSSTTEYDRYVSFIYHLY